MKRALLIIGVIIAIPLALIGIGWGIQMIQTAPMVAIADRIKPEPGWELISENTTGGPPCIDVPCYTMHRTYQTQKVFTEEDLKAFADKAGLGLTTDGPCRQKSEGGGTQEMCSANGASGDYKVRIRVISPYENGPELISISLAKTS